MSELKLQQYRDLGAILTDTFNYIKVHFISLGKALIFLVFPFYLVSGIMVGNSYAGFFSAVFDNPEANPANLITGDFLFGMFLLLFSSAALVTATMTHVKLAAEHGEVTLSLLMEKFGKNFFTLLLVYVLILTAVFFGMMAFIIPGIFIGIRLFVSPVAAIIEDLNPIEALQRSWKLVEGHWWFTLAVYLVMNTISSFMSYVLIIPLTIFIGLLTTAGASGSGAVGTGIGIFYALIIVVASLFSVLLMVAMSLHYFNLVERKEGKGLRAQIEELG